MVKKAIVSVINDLVTDQRVDRACRALIKCGYDVTLVGRILPNSLPINNKPYATHRMHLIFTSGPLFYLEYQIRLFLFLLFKKADLLYANDLDTLLPNYICYKIKSAKIIYDSHELFTEVPELIAHPKKQKIWKSIEKSIFPKLNTIITVNQSIADIYESEYHKKLAVVRNIPITRQDIQSKTRKSMGLPTDQHIIILQGAGINMDRGAEELVEAMQYTEGVILLIVGSGDVIEQLKERRITLKLEEKIIITGKVAYEQLAQYTRLANLGLSLDKDTNLNYRYSLPNKLFDYIQAGIPVLVSPLVEISEIVKTYNIGDILLSHDPKEIAKSISLVFEDKKRYEKWKINIKKAQEELNWNNEEQKLISCIQNA